MKEYGIRQKKCNIYDYDHEVGSYVADMVGPEYISLNFPENIGHLQPDSIVLDIGCGRGDGLLGLSCLKIGLDISKVNLGYAMRKDSLAHFVLGDAETLPFRSGVFDAVIMVAVVHHIPDHTRLFQEVHRILKEHGQLLIADSNTDSHLVIYPLMDLAMLCAHVRGHYAEGYGISLRGGMELLSELGFSIEHVDATGSALKGFWQAIVLPLINGANALNQKSLPLMFMNNLVGAADRQLGRTLHPRYLERYRLVAIKSSEDSKGLLPTISRI